MHFGILTLTLLVSVINPSIVSALCANSGESVVYVNGILTSLVDAQQDLFKLQTKYFEKTGDRNVVFRNGYNEPHLAGGGDLLESAAQAFGTSISDFDLNTILMQIHPQVTTRKILLVGHSQGTFYTNAVYRYFLEHGVPEGSVAVYNLATPASYVEGGGAYLTSANDKLINSIRPLMIKAGAREPLPANITISLPPGEESDKTGGHHFSSSYLGGAPDRIIWDITNALGKLSAVRAAETGDGCFTPPPATIGYRTQAVLFSVADPLAQDARSGIAMTGRAIATAKNTVVAAAGQAQNALAAVLRALSLRAGTAAGQSAAVASALPPTTPAVPILAKTSASVSPPAPVKIQSTAPKEAPRVINTPQEAQPIQPPPPMFPPPLMAVAPGFGGGGPAPVADAAPAPADTPPAVPLYVEAPLDGALFAASTVSATGTTTPGYSVVVAYGSSSATTTADGNGDWSFTLTLSEGATTLGFAAEDSEGNASPAVTRTVTVDLPPSPPSLSVSECAFSLSSDSCLVATTTATLSWGAVSDASYYGIVKNDIRTATTTATGVTMNAADNATTIFAVVAYDAAGNAATSTSVSIEANTHPLIINEIAWGGTAAVSSDEWIEFKNTSSDILDLSRVTLVAEDGSPYIALAGTVAPSSFFLIERREEATSKAGDLITPFDQLANTGEEFRLQWYGGISTTTIDRTPAVSTCDGWCSGFGPIISMERTTGGADGTLEGSWQYGTTTNTSVMDAGGHAILGTPGAENSEGGEPPDFGFF